MSSLNLTESARKTFKCPNCQQYISAGICPKCSFRITDEMRERQLAAYDEEIKNANRKFYVPFIFGGIGVFLFGSLSLAAKFLDDDFSPRGFVLAIFGLGAFFYGLRGFYRER